MKKWWVKKRVKIIVLTSVIVIGAALAVFVGWYSFAVPADAEKVSRAQNMFTVAYADTGTAITLTPAVKTNKGILLYPGGRIDPAAYAYKMGRIAESGVTVVIAKPLLHLAPLDIHKPSTYKKLALHVTDWYVAGHTIGGVKACEVARKTHQFNGLILLGSYCVKSIAESQLKVLSIAGGNDTLTSAVDIVDHKPHLPADTTFVTVPGLNNAGFANYERQKGDGDLTITDAQATDELGRLIPQFVGAGILVKR